VYIHMYLCEFVCVCVCVCVCVGPHKEMYYKNLPHEIMEAEKSRDLWLEARDPREMMVFSSLCINTWESRESMV
jgi:hypothetical protein